VLQKSSGPAALFGFKFRSLAMPSQETEGTFNSIKKFWTYIKHKKTDDQGISSLKQDGKLITDPIPKANVMNDQLKFVFSNAEKITESGAGCFVWT
jgi:hypothetical protein